MKCSELKKKYIEFFKNKGHKEIVNSSLIPENDPTVLFTTAGMHPLIPYLLGERHPQGKRLVDVQKCIRTGDIDEVGDEVHLTFFEMLGNWSLGDYFKEDAIKMSYEFLTNVLRLEKERIAVSCFKGDEDAPEDSTSARVWEGLGISKERIVFLGKEENWWGPAGATGPCGPDTEMFYYTGENIPKKFNSKDKKWVEIWNDVFMEYNKLKGGKFEKLKQQNVDTGMGVERTVAVLNGVSDVYEIDVLKPLMDKVSGLAKGKDVRSKRIIVDHLRAATFILNEGVIPSNLERGYVLRRLIRRAIRHGRLLGIQHRFCKEVVKEVFIVNKWNHFFREEFILNEIGKEEDKFESTLEQGLKIAEKIFSKKTPIKKEKYLKLMQLPNHVEILKDLWNKKRAGKDYSIKEAKISKKEIDKATVTGKEGFLLYQSYGFPAEMIIELATEKNLFFHRGGFRSELEKHQELSRTATAGRFKSGLADHSGETTKLHTATHLLLQALKDVLKDKSLMQKGSNITAERLRFDFSFPRKLTEDEIKKVEDIVNEKIREGLKVRCEEMKLEEAKKIGVTGVFEHKYGERVKVYSIGDYSRELCSGPHVTNTKELGKFKIVKEESSSAGVRRIKAVLE